MNKSSNNNNNRSETTNINTFCEVLCKLIDDHKLPMTSNYKMSLQGLELNEMPIDELRDRCQVHDLHWDLSLMEPGVEGSLNFDEVLVAVPVLTEYRDVVARSMVEDIQAIEGEAGWFGNKYGRFWASLATTDCIRLDIIHHANINNRGIGGCVAGPLLTISEDVLKLDQGTLSCPIRIHTAAGVIKASMKLFIHGMSIDKRSFRKCFDQKFAYRQDDEMVIDCFKNAVMKHFDKHGSFSARSPHRGTLDVTNCDHITAMFIATVMQLNIVDTLSDLYPRKAVKMSIHVDSIMFSDNIIVKIPADVYKSSPLSIFHNPWSKEGLFDYNLGGLARAYESCCINNQLFKYF